MDAYATSIIVCIRTTINIDDKLLAEAQHYTGEKEKTKLVHMGLQALIQDHVAKRLVALGGTDPHAQAALRRRPWK
jgi:Arc/MetJ family transcription regulator